MTFPHQCRCAICGEIGMITPGLPNVFAKDLTANVPDTPPAGFDERRKPIVPTETSSAPHWHERGGKPCYAKACYDPGPVGMVPALGAPFPFDDLATCLHGYVRCMICKFPAP